MNERLDPCARILLGSSIAVGPGKAALREAIGGTSLLDDEARAFYLHHSFLPLPDLPYRLFRRMSDIETLSK